MMRIHMQDLYEWLSPLYHSELISLPQLSVLETLVLLVIRVLFE